MMVEPDPRLYLTSSKKIRLYVGQTPWHVKPFRGQQQNPRVTEDTSTQID